MDVGLSRTKISYRWDRRGLSCFIIFYLDSSILTLEPLVMVFASKFWCSSADKVPSSECNLSSYTS